MPDRAFTVLSHFPIAMLEASIQEFPDLEFREVPGEGELPSGVRGEVLLTYMDGRPNLAAVVGTGVRWIHAIGTGVDAFPLEAVGKRILTCARGASAVPIAEWTLAMLLAFEKQLPAAWVDAPPERWSRHELGTLRGKTLGLIGLGGIGAAIAARAQAFEMRVRACRRTPAPSPIEGVELAPDVFDLAASADHLGVAAPATQATRHLIGRNLLSKAKPGLHLVNIARGSLIDQDALRAALDEGRIARASLDVMDPEPLPDGHWLYSHPRVRLSPHVSWHTPGTIADLVDYFAQNLRRYRAGETLHGEVDLEAGY